VTTGRIGRRSVPPSEPLAGGRFVSPPLIEPHHHLDITGTAGQPRWNERGTLAEGIELWAKDTEDITVEDIKERATRTVDFHRAW